jgi:hypothetical protein
MDKTENIVMSKRALIILEIMSIQRYKMWSDELRADFHVGPELEIRGRRQKIIPGQHTSENYLQQLAHKRILAWIIDVAQILTPKVLG